jgi:hypothetical protein
LDGFYLFGDKFDDPFAGLYRNGKNRDSSKS